MHELVPLLAKLRAEEIQRSLRDHAKRSPEPHRRRRRPFWRILP
jgi:hypothetical protein